MNPHPPAAMLRKLLLWMALPLYILDQLTKAWTVSRFPLPWRQTGEPGVDFIPVVDNVFHLVRVHNQGVAFGFGNGTAWAPIVFLVVPVLAVVMIRIFWKKGVFNHPLSTFAVALILTGIAGNLTDRLVQGFLLEERVFNGMLVEGLKNESFWQRFSAGYVVDFVAVKLPLYDKIVPSSGGWWPAFNVADSCICIAAALLIIAGFREEAAKPKKDAE